MRSIMFLAIILVYISCKARDNLKYKNLRYLSYSYQGTMNNSFINKRIFFLNGTDSVFFNVKIPFDNEKRQIYDSGIFYNCKLEKDTLYSFELKQIQLSKIPREQNSYYYTNAEFSTLDSSVYKEVKKDTPYKYSGNNGLYVDIKNKLYIIEKMTPATGCVFQH